MRFDLHCHSEFSDGTLAPAEVVARARAAGVQVLALTDHDTTAGLAQARAAARDQGIRLVDGVEISVTWDGTTIHMVGLQVRPGDPVLEAGLAGLRAERARRAVEIDRRLAQAGIPGARAGAAALARGPILSRTHFARYLVQAGHAPSLQAAFDRYLGRRGRAHVGGRWAALEEAVGWIHAAGGQAVIAHPARYRFGRGRLRRLLADFQAAGGDALELISGRQPPGTEARMAALAREFGLAASLGSDYHGPEQVWLELGRLPPLPGGCRPVWRHW